MDNLNSLENLTNLENSVLNSNREFNKYYGDVIKLKAISLTETKILTLRSIKRESGNYFDFRAWIKWANADKFHPSKGVCLSESLMLRDVMPILNQWYGTTSGTIEGA